MKNVSREDMPSDAGFRAETERERLTAKSGNANAGTCEIPAGGRICRGAGSGGKRRFSVCVRAAGLFVCAALFAFLFFSCELFNDPLSDFIEEWTRLAAVVRHSFDCDVPETGGAANLPSGGNRTLTYFLTNPQNYVISPSVSFTGGSPANGADYTVAQDAGDRSVIRLTFTEAFLARLDGTGTMISPTLHMTEAGSGRSFDSYTVPLRVNSAPSAVTEAVLLHNYSNYFVCFQLPDVTDGLNSDIVAVRVESSLFNSEFPLAPGAYPLRA